MNNDIWRDLENLIVVAGHAVYVADHFDNPEDDARWCLQSFQKGEPPFYLEHIECGVAQAGTDQKSLLIFSGGETRAEAGRRSEAEGYFRLAEHFNWWQKTEVKGRATTEGFARDSFENLLFSICRFRQCTGSYPQTITLISWAFKERRFDLHRQAIRFPESQFRFVGVNNPADLVAAKRGERKAVEAFSVDPYGIQETVTQDDQKIFLGEKRKARNPFNRHHPYAASCPELAALLQHRAFEIYEDDLPWQA